MDSTRLLITSCPCSLFSPILLLRPVTISTTKSSGHDPRHSSCYVSTVWSMMLWDVSFSLGAVQLSPQWDHALALMSPNLCYDIRFQVTLSRLVSLAKCCSEQFGCHQSASVFCCQYPLSSLGISADSCAKQLSDKSHDDHDSEAVETAQYNPWRRGNCPDAVRVCAFFPLHTVHWFVLGDVLMCTIVWSSTAKRLNRFSDNVTLLFTFHSPCSVKVVHTDASCKMSPPQPHTIASTKFLIRTCLRHETWQLLSLFSALSTWWQPSDRHEDCELGRDHCDMRLENSGCSACFLSVFV